MWILGCSIIIITAVISWCIFSWIEKKEETEKFEKENIGYREKSIG